MGKCRKCRQRPHNMDYSPKRDKPGSIRKRKRQKMREAKKARMRELAN